MLMLVKSKVVLSPWEEMGHVPCMEYGVWSIYGV